MNSQQRRNRRRQHLAGLTPHDSQEIKRFSAFLKDQAALPVGELYAKHQQYLGLSDAEVAAAQPLPEITDQGEPYVPDADC